MQPASLMRQRSRAKTVSAYDSLKLNASECRYRASYLDVYCWHCYPYSPLAAPMLDITV